MQAGHHGGTEGFRLVAQHKEDPQGHDASALVLQSGICAELRVILGASALGSLVCPCPQRLHLSLRDSVIGWLNVSSRLEGS